MNTRSCAAAIETRQRWSDHQIAFAPLSADHRLTDLSTVLARLMSACCQTVVVRAYQSTADTTICMQDWLPLIGSCQVLGPPMVGSKSTPERQTPQMMAKAFDMQ